jgi:hypothetical protein
MLVSKCEDDNFQNRKWFLGYLLDGTLILLAGLPLLFSWLFWYCNPTDWFAPLLFATSIFFGWMVLLSCWLVCTSSVCHFYFIGCFGTSVQLAGLHLFYWPLLFYWLVGTSIQLAILHLIYLALQCLVGTSILLTSGASQPVKPFCENSRYNTTLVFGHRRYCGFVSL